MKEPCSPRRLSRVFVALAATSLALAADLRVARADTYPDKPIHIVVPYAAGSTDVVVRAFAERLGQMWGQSLVVENKGGASAIIGTDFVARSAPDGYTLLATTDSPITSNPYLFKKLPHDPIKDLAPITQLFASNMIIVANPSLAATNLKELVALAKARPGKLTYASWGDGSQAHMVFEALKRETGIDMIQIPYKGLAPATIAALSGEVDVTLSTPGVALGHLAAGKLRPLAITYKVGVPVLSQVPSMAESGFPSLDPGAWMGLFAPTQTPPDVIRTIQRAIAKVLEDPDFRAREIDSRAVIAGGMASEEFARLVKEDFDAKGKTYKALGLEPQ